MSVKVSVLTTTYNHERFIAQNIIGVLAQQTNFAVEHIIGEDCSTDGTRAVVEHFQQQRPDIVKPILRPRNVGRRANFIECFHTCQGDYIAIVEGDDYWTASDKLQAQADFLDANPDHAICFHALEHRYEDKSQLPRINRREQARYSLRDLLDSNFIPTCTVMFRNHLFDEFPAWFNDVPAGDWPLHMLNAQHGDIGYIDDVMAVHRTHSGGVWSPKPASERRQSMVSILETFRDNLDPRYRPILEQNIARWQFKVLNALLVEGRYTAAGRYGLDLLLRPDVPRVEVLRAAGWSSQARRLRTAS
ncbi:MAG: glycosyltransferase [Caldilineae bacterium]|nr:glycosyltransferase [Anaerolineae bacterium]MCB0199396.1 glycosyltransferase [Anaerolineae bacterium]MCB0203514.1 glycosyltransferase [Anaerolineae bacterium]MCB9153273.1 glycosyltransferase [Caldilineae bacterium]